ncbi:NUDIX hydrolase [Rhodopseudomonas sp. NSM]|uniref:NUDIX hydrolase n=1 Tax=Rhodopseudomonas sp. NSM TaxID=3457630 RepID=UPI0040350D11
MRAPVLAAGGIVLRRGGEPLFAVVRMRKRNDWVLPKGKLDGGETPRAAAAREVLEETGHLVEIHEFIGTLACEAGGRTKVVHFWRMEAAPVQTHPLMKDIRAVDWLPLREAVERLSRSHEQAFLAHVGPLVLAAAARTPPALQSPWTDDVIAELADAPPLAGSDDTADPQPSMLRRIRDWWRGATGGRP